MDVVEQEAVNVQNAVIVSGITLTESDQVLETYLSKFGFIRRNLLIDEFHRNAIVEFTHNPAMCNIEPQLPLTVVSPTDAATVFRVCALSTVCTPTTSSATAECFEKLQAIASTNAECLQGVLQRELTKVGGVGFIENAPSSVEPGLQHRPLGSEYLTHGTSTPQRLERCASPAVLRIESENPVKVTSGATPPCCSITLILARLRQYQ